MRYLLDTNILSEFVKANVNPGVVSWVRRTDEFQMAISVISVGEIQKGISRMPTGKRQTNLQTWLDEALIPRFRARTLTLDVEDLQGWGKLLGESAKSGRPLPPVDALLVAQARNRNLVVVTRNVRDFEQCGIDIVNPWI